jgi:hypothetical protein
MSNWNLKNFKHNIKYPGGYERSEIPAKVFLTGDNGTGKTTFLNALELALTGEAHDLGVRTKSKSSVWLRQLIPFVAGPKGKAIRDEKLYAQVELEREGIAFHYSWELVPGSKPKHTILCSEENQTPPKISFIHREVTEALQGSRLKMLRFLFKHFGSHDQPFPYCFQENKTLATQVELQNINGWAQRVLFAEEKARAAMNQHKAVSRSLKIALAQLGGAPPSDKAALASAITTLTSLQLERGWSICGVCGQETDQETLRDRHAKASAAIGDVPISPRISALKYAAETSDRHAEEASTLADFCVGLMERHVSELKDNIDQRVSMYSRWGQPESIQLHMTKSAIYFTHQGIALLSGAEMVWLTAAISASIYPDNPFETVQILATPDRGFDNQRLGEMLKAFGSATSVDLSIVQSAIKPRGRLSALWYKIDMNEEGMFDG